VLCNELKKMASKVVSRTTSGSGSGDKGLCRRMVCVTNVNNSEQSVAKFQSNQQINNAQ